jgi:hypothetical protein
MEENEIGYIVGGNSVGGMKLDIMSGNAAGGNEIRYYRRLDAIWKHETGLIIKFRIYK